MSAKLVFCPNCKITAMVDEGDKYVCDYCGTQKPKVKK